MIKKRPRRPKKFRFQFVAHWLISRYKPCKVADVGGGKGLLSYLLNEAGWESVVIDPFWQELPSKYRSADKKRVKIQDRNSVKRITEPFNPDMVDDYDLIVGVHLHGANISILESCKEKNKDFLLFPCCVIGEPIEKMPDIDWRKSLVGYAVKLGLDVKTVHLNIMGKSIGLYTDSHISKREDQIDLSDILLTKYSKEKLEEGEDYILSPWTSN